MEKSELRKLVYSSGTITLLQDGLSKVVSGETTFEEILKLIDLDDDLGTDSNIGLQNSLEDTKNADKTQVANSIRNVSNVQNVSTQVNNNVETL